MTDDGEVFLALLLPHYVELAHLSDRMAFSEAVTRLRLWLPHTFAQRGVRWIEREWYRLCEVRSVAVSSRDANPVHRDTPFVFWLPTAETVSRDLNLTRARRDAINAVYAAHEDGLPIRGLPAIDPLSDEEAREADRVRKEKERRAKGVKAQSSRTETADETAFREGLGISFGRWYRATKAGPDAVLALVMKEGGCGLMADKMCPADIYEYGANTNYPLLTEEESMPKIEIKTDETMRDLTERFRVVVRIVSPVRAQPLPVIRAKIVPMRMAA
ncbi:hypothetical protein [Methylobacterium sp. J-090]|uniref:hypothetical protein n=1 Tax=Methylobacterium sp. J-090 TaxID=2836666 RepID=UPI001FBB8C63|nr:hypothetical protein [Methylobacterium sp. J-090]MCJ2081000.1 hypothetical protein [Methylobacterium sp. J-090]